MCALHFGLITAKLYPMCMWGTRQEHLNILGNVGCQGSTQLVKELIQRKGRTTAGLLRKQQTTLKL